MRFEYLEKSKRGGAGNKGHIICAGMTFGPYETTCAVNLVIIEDVIARTSTAVSLGSCCAQKTEVAAIDATARVIHCTSKIITLYIYS